MSTKNLRRRYSHIMRLGLSLKGEFYTGVTPIGKTISIPKDSIVDDSDEEWDKKILEATTNKDKEEKPCKTRVKKSTTML